MARRKWGSGRTKGAFSPSWQEGVLSKCMITGGMVGLKHGRARPAVAHAKNVLGRGLVGRRPVPGAFMEGGGAVECGGTVGKGEQACGSRLSV